tara:strand:+ start:14382 stop:14672 length:291 start_codon:yes stop_codon:yes gene_type:complete
MKLIKVVQSKNPEKKFDAHFETDTERIKVTSFGAKGMSDYTIHHDKSRRESYRIRHRRDLRTNDPTRAGFLSFYILWGESKSLTRNIAEYKKMFNL